jgi:hypothetical protein
MEIRVAREKWFSETEFSNEACKAPHINGSRVASFEDDLGCSVVSGLDVGIDLMI